MMYLLRLLVNCHGALEAGNRSEVGKKKGTKGNRRDDWKDRGENTQIILVCPDINQLDDVRVSDELENGNLALYSQGDAMDSAGALGFPQLEVCKTRGLCDMGPTLCDDLDGDKLAGGPMSPEADSARCAPAKDLTERPGADFTPTNVFFFFRGWCGWVSRGAACGISEAGVWRWLHGRDDVVDG